MEKSNDEQNCIEKLDTLFWDSTSEAITTKDLILEELFPLNKNLAFDYAKEFYHQASINNHQYYLAEMARCIGRFYILSGNMAYAYKYLSEADKISQHLFIPEVENRLKPVLYTLLGYYYYYQRDYHKAKNYTLRGVKQIEKIGVINTFIAGLLISQYINLTEFALIEKDWEEAKKMLDIAEDLFTKYDFPSVAYLCIFVHKAKYLIEIKQCEAALNYLKKADALKSDVALQYCVLLPIQWTNYYIEKHDKKSAAIYFKEAEQQLEQLNMLNELTDLYRDWGNFLELEKDYKMALKIQKKYAQALANLKNEENMKAVLEAEYQQEIQKEQEARAQLQKEMELKENFFLNITHDVKNTLFLVLNPLEEIKYQEDLNMNAIERSIDIAIQNSQSLLALSNRLLDVNRMVEEKVILREVSQDWIKILHECWARFKEEARGKGVIYKFNSNVSQWVAPIDSNKLQRIITNLLGNAIKFTPENENVKLSIEFEQAGTLLNIIVEDTGLGIAREDQYKVFEKFYQAHASQLLGGTGLGLTIVKYLCNSMQFNLELESETGIGSRFHIQKKMEPESFNPQPLHDKVWMRREHTQNFIPDPEKDLHTYLLIVDDNIAVRNYLAEILSKEGYTVNTAASVVQARELLDKQEPDLILLDYRMPEEDGLSFAQNLKQNLETSHIPVILMTASTKQSSTQLLSLKSGVDVFLTKPVSNQRVLLEIQKLLKYRKSLQQKYQNKFAEILEVKDSVTEEQSKDEQFLEDVLQLIDKHIASDEIGPDFLAEHLYLHSKTIYRKLQQLVGVSINELIRKRRLYKASLLLKKKKDHSIQNIAYEVGFSSLSYFTKCFKREFGVPPSKFRTEE